jgi:C1A family cysteine protease
MPKHVYDCRRFHPKLHDDLRIAIPAHHLTAMPPHVDLRPKCPPVYDQGDLGSCTGNALGGGYEFVYMKEGLQPSFMPSRLFIYYSERVIEHDVSQDAGAAISDGVKVLLNTGVCPEGVWPYITSKFATKPSSEAYSVATHHKSKSILQIDNTNLTEMKSSLAQGWPIAIGFTVYESFESAEVAKTGIVPMPKPHEQELGGHAVLIVGYDDASKRFIVRNSWSADWAQAGYFTIPYAYMTNADLASDAHSIRQAS